MGLRKFPATQAPLVFTILVASLIISGCASNGAPVKNGFDLAGASIPASEVRSGGPGRDGIPAIDNPSFDDAENAFWLHDDDRIIGFTESGDARAYPLRILVWHEIVNDTVGGKPIAVTYCPLCATAMVFDRSVGEQLLTFGVSGLLFQSDVLMYDRQTESLWTQLGMRAVSGSLQGTELEWLPAEQTTWKDWRERHPETRVLSRNTGFSRNYSRDPYESYARSDRPMFPVPEKRRDLRPMRPVIGTIVEGQAIAFDPRDLRGKTPALLEASGGPSLRIEYDPETEHASLTNTATGESIPVVHVFWFAWQAFYPETRLIREKDLQPPEA